MFYCQFNTLLYLLYISKIINTSHVSSINMKAPLYMPIIKKNKRERKERKKEKKKKAKKHKRTTT